MLRLAIFFHIACPLPLLVMPMFAGENPASWTNPIDGAVFAPIPAGKLTVISRTAADKDTTITIVFPDAFWLAKTEVTVRQFARFVTATGYLTSAEKDSSRFTWKNPGFLQSEDHPVVFLSYEDAQAYAAWAGADLPTEAEWLYACRAGTESTFFWGDSIKDNYLWHRGNTNGTGTRPVATRQPNAWGLFDMVGNAWEYTRVCDTVYAVRGASWTRCPSYRTRQGYVANDLIDSSVEPRLTPCAESTYPPYPWDDDRGVRLVKRKR